METTPCTYRISVKAVIKDDGGRVLLLREEDGSWELPGGGLEHGEDPKEALTREITEETGYSVDWISDQPTAFWTIRKEVGSPTLKYFAFVTYDAKVSGDFNPGAGTSYEGEAQEAKYFSREEATALKLHENTSPYFSQIT